MGQLSNRCRRGVTAFVVVSIAYASHVLAAGLQWGPLQPGAGPWAIDYLDTLWGTTYDPGIAFGYNQNASGVPFLAGEPGLSLEVEGNYYVASNGHNQMEVYIQYIDGFNQTVLRPMMFTINRATRRVDGAWIGGAPTINFGDANTNKINAQISTNALYLYGVNPAYGTVVNLQTAAGSNQPGVLDLGYNGIANVLQIFPTSATSVLFQIGGTNGFNYYKAPLGGNAAGSIAVGGIDDNSAIGVFDSKNASSNVKALVARGSATMGVDVFEVQDQKKSVVHGVNNTGVVYMALAPAPSANPANGVDLYVDQADNRLKYRDASGVVHVILTSP
jgi:hypothetical protein